MSFKQLAIRTKKSLSGLRGSGHGHGQVSSPPETPQRRLQNQNDGLVLEEFGTRSSPCSPSSARDSPSRRSRFMQESIRSLRKIRSNFDINRSKNPDEAVALPEQTPPMARPSLTLNFELSPPDQPMFKSANSSGLDVRRSSPIAVPTMCAPNTPVSPGPLPPGTVPDSPAPLNKVLVQESILSNSLRNLDLLHATPSGIESIPTPMPGTNMPLEGVQRQTPEIVVSSPSAPNMKEQGGYFAIPVVKVAGASEQGDNTAAQDSGDSQPTGAGTATNPIEDALDKLRIVKVRKTTVEDYESDHRVVIDPDTRKSFEGKADTVSAYLALNGHKSSSITEGDKDNDIRERRLSDWSRHAGLYDGTGYAVSGLDHAISTTDSGNISPFSHRENSEYAAKVDTQGTGTTTPLEQRPASVFGGNSFVSDEKEVVVDEKEELKKIYRQYARLHHKETSEMADGSAVEMATTLPADVMETNIDFEKRAKREAEMMNRVTDESLGG